LTDKLLLLETRIEEIQKQSRVGPIQLNSEGVTLAFISEAKKCEQKYGDLMNQIGVAGGSAATDRFHGKDEEIILSKYSNF
jgi:hypothetical protein